MAPRKSWDLFEAGRAMQMEKLFTLQQQFHDMRTVLWSTVKEAQQLINGAREKIMVRLGGLSEMPLRLLSPYQSCSEEQYQACKRVMYEKYPDWIAVQP